MLAILPLIAVGLGFAFWRHLYMGGHCRSEDLTLPWLKAVGPSFAVFIVGAWIVLGAREPIWRWLGLAVLTATALVMIMLTVPLEVACMPTPTP